uniref:Uncharacterized protein n=1 Tax=Ciona intestinalis TaxID=7719 RepID=H2XYW8_CIOIN
MIFDHKVSIWQEKCQIRVFSTSCKIFISFSDGLYFVS